MRSLRFGIPRLGPDGGPWSDTGLGLLIAASGTAVDGVEVMICDVFSKAFLAAAITGILGLIFLS
jgi:hypothetical protein